MTEEFKKYIGIKEVEARPCTADKADEILGKKVCRDNADEQGNGYLVRYKDGYTSWSQAKAFEEAYNLCGTGVSVRERIQEISELMKVAKRLEPSNNPGGISVFQSISILTELQHQKNELAMFLERLQADVSYSESISRAMPASCSCSDGLTVPGGGMGYEEAQEIVMHGGAVARRGADFILVLQIGSCISKDKASGGAAKYLADTGVDTINILPHIDAVLPGEQVLVGWCPSNEDWEARDWYIVKGPKAPENGPSIEPAPENSGIGETQCINPSQSYCGDHYSMSEHYTE